MHTCHTVQKTLKLETLLFWSELKKAVLREATHSNRPAECIPSGKDVITASGYYSQGRRQGSAIAVRNQKALPLLKLLSVVNYNDRALKLLESEGFHWENSNFCIPKYLQKEGGRVSTFRMTAPRWRDTCLFLSLSHYPFQKEAC